jgi:hypothetical protein
MTFPLTLKILLTTYKFISQQPRKPPAVREFIEAAQPIACLTEVDHDHTYELPTHTMKRKYDEIKDEMMKKRGEVCKNSHIAV